MSSSDRALEPDYDTDPGRWRSWEAPTDVHHLVAPELTGRVLDIGCGEGRLATLVGAEVSWVGVDSSPTLLAASGRPGVVLGDMRALPFPEDRFDAVLHLWCLYHLDDPVAAIAEARRVLRPGGRYYACTSARDNDPELMAEGYPPTTFDAEEAPAIVGRVFDDVQAEPWDDRFAAMPTRDEVRAYCRHHVIPPERADEVDLPLRLTKRGVLVRARKPGMPTRSRRAAGR